MLITSNFFTSDTGEIHDAQSSDTADPLALEDVVMPLNLESFKSANDRLNIQILLSTSILQTESGESDDQIHIILYEQSMYAPLSLGPDEKVISPVISCQPHGAMFNLPIIISYNLQYQPHPDSTLRLLYRPTEKPSKTSCSESKSTEHKIQSSDTTVDMVHEARSVETTESVASDCDWQEFPVSHGDWHMNNETLKMYLSHFCQYCLVEDPKQTKGPEERNLVIHSFAK